MIAKISVTDVCGAHCTTCLQHLVEPQHTMTPLQLYRTLQVLLTYCGKFIINATGDYLMLPDNQDYSDAIGEFQNRHKPFVSITTNAGFTGKPGIHASEIICSLNALDAKNFDRYIGLEIGLDRVVENIRWIAGKYGCVEIHSLKWQANPDPDKELLRLFGDLPCRIRISEKVENQFRSEVTEPRAPCDYLTMLTVDPQGRIKLCPHDFFGKVILGTVTNVPGALRAQALARQAHDQLDFGGICGRCNYNVTSPGKVYYIK